MCEPCTHSCNTKAPFETMTPGLASSSGCWVSVGRWTGQVLVCDSKLGRYAAGASEIDDDVVGSWSGNPQRVGWLFATDDFGGVGDNVDDLSVGGRGRRIGKATQRGHEIGGNHGFAIRPARIGPQVERVFLSVRADGPVRCHAGCDTCVLVECGESLAQITEDSL